MENADLRQFGFLTDPTPAVCYRGEGGNPLTPRHPTAPRISGDSIPPGQSSVDIGDTVEFFHHKDPDDASRRAQARRWGVVYMYEQGGTPTPTPPPTPATPNQ